MTNEQIDAQKFTDIRKRHELQARRTDLHQQLESFAKSWRELSLNVRDCDNYNTIAVDDISITVTRPSNPEFPTRSGMTIVVKAPTSHFDIEAIRPLITDLEDTKKELSKVEGKVNSFGLGL